MKKLILTLFLGFLILNVFSQISIKKEKITNIPPGIKADHIKSPDIGNNRNTRADVSNTFVFPDVLEEDVFDVSKFRSVLFPDTFVKARFIDQNGNPILDYVLWNSVGAMFEPVSELFDMYGPALLGNQQPYNLDTIGFFYSYERYIDTETVWTFNLKNHWDQFTISSIFWDTTFTLTNLSDTIINISSIHWDTTFIANGSIVFPDSTYYFTKTFHIDTNLSISKTLTYDTSEIGNTKSWDTTLNFTKTIIWDTSIVHETLKTGSVVDTLVVKIYNIDKIYGYTWSATDEPFATVGYSIPKGEGTNYTSEYRIPFTNADTHSLSSGFWGIFELPVDMNAAQGGPIAMTFTFIPGHQYYFGDTMGGEWDDPVPDYPLNKFEFLIYRDNTDRELQSHNNGLMITRFNRYKAWYDEGSRYIPGTAWNSPNYPFIWFTISYDDSWVGIDERNIDFTFNKIYPNPAKNNAKIKLNLKSSETINVELFDILGKKISTIINADFPAGEQIIPVDLSNVHSGVYLCKISAGDASTTQTLIVE